MKKYLRLNEKNIDKYKNKFSWQGSGIEADDPIIINSINPHYHKLKLKNLTRLIQITGIFFAYVYIIGCRNILTEGCQFGHLNLTLCQHVEVRNNILPSFVLLFIRNNKILGNKIYQDSYDMIKNSLGERHNAKILSKVLGLTVIMMLFTLSYASWPYFFLSLLIFGTVIYFKIRSKTLIKRADTLPDNIFRNNIKISVGL